MYVSLSEAVLLTTGILDLSKAFNIFLVCSRFAIGRLCSSVEDLQNAYFQKIIESKISIK